MEQLSPQEFRPKKLPEDLPYDWNISREMEDLIIKHACGKHPSAKNVLVWISEHAQDFRKIIDTHYIDLFSRWESDPEGVARDIERRLYLKN